MIGFIQAGVLIVCLSLLLLIQASHGFTTEATPDGLRGPIFLEEPPSLTVIQNSEGGVIPCSVYGRPAPVTQWIRLDGSPVENVPGVLEILHNNSLYFLPFDDDSLDPGIHTQTYRCRAENVIGSIISRSMRTTAVLLDQVEEFSIQLNDIWVMRGGTAVFSCDVNPLYVRDYVKVTGWTQSTTPIQADNRYSMMADGTLHVRNVRDSDGSLAFRCKATVLLTGATQSSDAAYIKVHDPPAGGKKPTVDDPFREITVKVDDTVELSCVTDGYPFPSYRWYKDGVSVNMADTRFKQMGGNLVVTKVVTSDTGEYKCNATNNMGSASVTRQLTINLPLSATITPATQVIDSGQSASFNCSLQGNPVPSVTWFKDGHPLVVDDHIFLQSATLLHINNVRRQDQGMYQCFAKNIQSEIQATSQLILGAAHPSFIKVFNDQYVTRGTSVTLRCIAAGNPTPVVTWILDGQPLVNQDHVSDFTSDAGDVISYVNISSANLENSGEYQCIATNNVGEVNHIARLNVYGIPYVRPMKNITATANEALSIRCYVTGYPVETITWHRDGRQLPVNHLQQVANGTLHILKVQKPYDAGEYTCSAVAAGGQGSSRSVYVNVLEPPVIDPFSIAAKKEGDRVTLPCVVSSGDLPIFIKWTKDGRDVPYYMGIVVETSGSYNSLLKIGDVNPIHDGNYTCHARNLAATVSFTAELHVDVPPRWEIEPQDTSVIRHNSVWLDCMAAGTPDPTIKWSKIDANGYDPVPLNFTATDHYMVNENGTLVISNAMEPDGGNYICHADNGIEHGLSKIIDLTVHVPARFDAPQKNYTVLRGYNITIDCQAIGDKPLSLTWTFKNRTVGSGIVSPRRMVGVQDTSRGKLSHFSFRPAQREDTGEYRCNAKNKYGFDMLHMRLTVLEPPESPANLSILEVTSRSVKLSWQPPFDGNSPLLNYIIEYQTSTGALQEARGPIRNISVPGEARQFVLENLHPAYLYNIRVRANNSVGLGSPSHQVAAKLLEEVPSAPPTEVEVKAIGSQKLQVTWKPPKLEHRNGVITGYFIGYKQSKNNSQFQFINKDVSPDLDPERQEEVVAQFIPKLNKFTKYIVNVKAYNKIGMGPASSDIEVFTLEDVPSQPPEDVQATALSSQTIKVVWEPPPLFTLHGILQGYKVLYKPVRKDEDETDAHSVKSTKLEVVLEDLEKYTNYSIQVLAFTRKGEGVRNMPIYVRTQEDVPGRPADIKAQPINNSSIMVSWQPPVHQNGIITAYHLCYSNTSSTAQESKIDVPQSQTSVTVLDLESHISYWVRVTASTRIGEGESTQILAVTPVNKAPAKIISFSREMMVLSQQTVTLPCVAVGEPEPEIVWLHRSSVLSDTDRISILANGSLLLDAVEGSDAANYTCKADNQYGTDFIIYSLSVQVDSVANTPPKPPVLSIAAVTCSTIQVNWLSGSNGGSVITGFVLRHRKEHGVWQEVTLGSKNRTFTALGLLCGTAYKFSIQAVNRLGRSESSNIISAKTNGSAPIMPAQSDLMKSVNATSVELDMIKWEIDNCQIKFFSIKYQVWGKSQWVVVTNSISWNTTLFTVQDLNPATWYMMEVTAHSEAGSTECMLKFATLTYAGITVQPLYVVHKTDTYFYEKAHIMIPLCVAIVLILVLIVGVALYCSRRREIIRYKENASNIRRDITAETSLMNDLDKRLNFDLDSPPDPSERFNKRNVNLLISLNSEENLNSNNQGWCFHSSSKTNSDNASLGRSEDDANINPYATFNELKLVFSENPTYNKAEPDSDEDSISLEKAEAQKAMMATLETTEEPKYVSKGTNPEEGDQQCYDNQGIVLSPRKYASADQIHALFTMAPPRPQSAYSKNRSHGTRSTPSDKGSQRHSLISSVTTVSSSRDELLEAFENSNRNPPPPVVYETEADSLSQPTDSSTGTEPGICQFTQSPPQPDEQREASCEVPRYEQDARYHREERYRPVVRHEGLDSRSSMRRHKGSRYKDTVSRGTGMHSIGRHGSKSKPTEEVTYVFNVEDSPAHARKPQTFESKIQTSRNGRDHSVWRKASGRGTPHVKVRYDTTPGSADNKPLVSAQVMSVHDVTPEEEESVSLLDRYYRPVPSRAESGDGVLRMEDDDKGYTEDFTVV